MIKLEIKFNNKTYKLEQGITNFDVLDKREKGKDIFRKATSEEMLKHWTEILIHRTRMQLLPEVLNKIKDVPNRKTKISV